MKEKLKKIRAWLSSPPSWFAACWIALTVLACAGSVILTVIKANEEAMPVLAYALFALAAITLAYTVYLAVKVLPRMKNDVVAACKRNAFLARLIENYGFRTLVFSAASLVFNLAYTALNVFFAFSYRAVWYGALAGYYLLLVVMRGAIVVYHGGKRKRRSSADTSVVSDEKLRELHRYLGCGIMLIIMPLCLSVVTLLTITDGRMMHEYAGLMIYTAAAYTFVKISLSVRNAFKAKRSDDMTVRAVRGIGLADAMVSVFSLQTALIVAFSDGAMLKIFTALTGGAVCALTLALGVYMLVVGSKQLKIAKEEYKNAK